LKQNHRRGKTTPVPERCREPRGGRKAVAKGRLANEKENRRGQASLLLELQKKKSSGGKNRPVLRLNSVSREKHREKKKEV